MTRWIYVDVDGTLTLDGANGDGEPRTSMVRVAQELYSRPDVKLVIWSARGAEYAEEWCRRHEVRADIYLTKPHVCVDDKPTVHRNKILILDPEEAEVFFDH